MVGIDWDNFTPASATIGGVLIGSSAMTMLASTGRIAGISGIVGGMVNPALFSTEPWRLSFLLGILGGGALGTSLFSIPTPVIDADIPTLVAAGLLVGFGTRLGNGCTSGHGVCGLSRLSYRSLIATLTFMGTGIASSALSPALSGPSKLLASSIAVGALAVLTKMRQPNSVPNPSPRSLPEVLATGFSGAVFGVGLALSGMTQPSKVLGFLNIFSDKWDPSLMFVMGSAVVLGTIGFNAILPSAYKNPRIFKTTSDSVQDKAKKPLLGSKWYVPTGRDLDLGLLLGSAVFGVGWGMAGMCPGPALISALYSQGGLIFSAVMVSTFALYNLL